MYNPNLHPPGKNDGTVQGVKYFEARPKHGIFVRADKLIQDRRGRAMRGHEPSMRRSLSRGIHVCYCLIHTYVFAKWLDLW